MTAPLPNEAPGWVRDAVFYQIFPDRFARSGRVHAPGPLEAWDAPPTSDGFKGGDLYGVIDHLDHLVELGITAIYLNPIFASAANHRYHTYDYFHVDPLLGGNDAFRALLDAAHAKGIRVIVDGVFNHCGRGFWAFHHVLETGGASPYVDWFSLNPEFLAARRPLDAYPVGDGPVIDHAQSPWLTRDGSWSLRELGFEAWWDLPALPKLNVLNPEVREYLRHGTFRILGAEGSAIAWLRESGEERIVVALNNGESEARLDVPLSGAAAAAGLMPLPGDGPVAAMEVGGGRAVLTVPARSGGAFRLD